MYKKYLLNAPAFIALVLLVACNGGGSSSRAPAVQTGTFVDSAVNGLHYATATQSGTTNAAGEFKYLVGETVSFSLGGIQLGNARGAASLSPLSLLDVSSVEAARQAGVEAELLNRLVLLQSLDQDNNPDNGIDLSGLDASLAEQTLDFSALPDTFAAGEYRRLVNENNGVYRSGTAALNHLLSTLNLQVEVNLPAVDRLDNDGDGVVDQIVNYEYNDRGQLLLITDIDSATNTLIRSAAFEYDQNSNLAAINETYDSLITDQQKQQMFEFDADFGLTHYALVVDGNTLATSDYTYDLVGNLILAETVRDLALLTFTQSAIVAASQFARPLGPLNTLGLPQVFALAGLDPDDHFFHPLAALNAFDVLQTGEVIQARVDDTVFAASSVGLGGTSRRVLIGGEVGGVIVADLLQQIGRPSHPTVATTQLSLITSYEYNAAGQLISQVNTAQQTIDDAPVVGSETSETSGFIYQQGVLSEIQVDYGVVTSGSNSSISSAFRAAQILGAPLESFLLPLENMEQSGSFFNGGFFNGGLSSFLVSYEAQLVRRFQFDINGELTGCEVKLTGDRFAGEFELIETGFAPRSNAPVVSVPYQQASAFMPAGVQAGDLVQDCSPDTGANFDDQGRITRLKQVLETLQSGGGVPDYIRRLFLEGASSPFIAPGFPAITLSIAERQFEYQDGRVSAIKFDRAGDGDFEDFYTYSYSVEGDITSEDRTRDGALIFSRSREYQLRTLPAVPR
ncbi:MAG: hypothetical protein KUG79_02960 [Pseudomonadales bacterium]|nr:hypothetical protein [Pseudomonadales bacterium]